MPRKRAVHGYLLPDIPVPDTRHCVTVPVPCDPGHMRAFLGQIEELGHWYNWDRDDAKTGKLCADLWRDIARMVAEQLTHDCNECGEIEIVMDVRQKPDFPCILQKTTDGVTWVDFADLRLCVPYIRRSPTTGRLSYSTDGVTFYEVPDGPTEWLDEPVLPPPPPREELTAYERRCIGSANAAYALGQVYAELADKLIDSFVTELGAVTAYSGIVTALFGSAATFIATFAGLTALYGIQEALAAHAWEEGATDVLRCILFKHATDTEGVVTFDFSDVQLDCVNDDSEYAAQLDAIAGILAFIGGDGLNLAGRTEAVTVAECDCETCGELMDFRYTDYGITPALGTWVDGQGFYRDKIWNGSRWQFQLRFRVPCPLEPMIQVAEWQIRNGWNTGGTGSYFTKFYKDGSEVWSTGGYYHAYPGSDLYYTVNRGSPIQVDEIEFTCVFAPTGDPVCNLTVESLYAHS